MSDVVTAAPAPSASPAEAQRRPPVWVWPSIALGLIYPALSRSARLDAELLQRLPSPPRALRRLPSPYQTLLIGLTLGVAVLFSLLRVGGELTAWLGVGIRDVYSESYIFMLLALAIGMLSPSAGLLLVLVHIPLDIIASLQATAAFRPQLEPLLPALTGRAVSWWLLWLLAVAIPLMARGIPGAAMASGQPRDPLLRKLFGYAGGALAAVALTWMWTAALPYLIRPVFTWSNLRFPTVPAIQPIQESGIVLIVAAPLLLIAVTVLRERFGVLEEEAYEIEEPDDLDDIEDEPLVSDHVQFIANIASHVFIVLGLGGLITGALDVALIFLAAFLGQVVAGRLASWGPLGALLVSVPWVVRFLLGFALTYLVGLIVSNFMFEPLQTDLFTSEFFPLIVTVAIGLAIMRVLLGASAPPDRAAPTDDRPPAEEAGSAPERAVGVLIAGLLAGGVFLLATPAVAYADNCSGWYDCYPTMESISAAGAGAAAIVALTAALAAARAQEPGRQKARRRRRTGGRQEAAGETTLAPKSFFQRLRDRALGNYYRRPPRT